MSDPTDDPRVHLENLERAVGGYERLLEEFQGIKLELERLKSLESYKQQETRIANQEIIIGDLRFQLKGYTENPLDERVRILESQLAIARKANHLEALQRAEARIIELEQKLEEHNG